MERVRESLGLTGLGISLLQLSFGINMPIDSPCFNSAYLGLLPKYTESLHSHKTIPSSP